MRHSSVFLALALSLLAGQTLAIPIGHRQSEDGDIFTLNQELEKLSINNRHGHGHTGQTTVTAGYTETKTYGPAPNAGVDASPSVTGIHGSANGLSDGENGNSTPQAQSKIHRRPHYTLQSLNQYLAQFTSGHKPSAGIIPDVSFSTEKQDMAVAGVDIIELVTTRSWGASDDEFD